MAIVELGQRINPNHPDVTLLADRGLAYALLGDVPAADRDLTAAKKAGAEEWVLRRAKTELQRLSSQELR